MVASVEITCAANLRICILYAYLHHCISCFHCWTTATGVSVIKHRQISHRQMYIYEHPDTHINDGAQQCKV